MSKSRKRQAASDDLPDLAYNGDVEGVRAALAIADVNQMSGLGFTALHGSIMSGSHDVVRMLLAAGADVNKPCEQGGMHPLYMLIAYPGAATAGDVSHTTLISHLLECGASTAKGAEDGSSPLHLAAERDLVMIVDKLLDAGADVNATRLDGVTPLYCACQSGAVQVATTLLARGADPALASDNGAAPLHQAAESGWCEIVQQLLSTGKLDVNQGKGDAVTPLLLAAECGHPTMIQLLLSQGAAVDKVSVSGYSPLFMACVSGHLECVRLLLDAGADIDKADQAGITPLKAAIIQSHTGVCDYLISRGAGVDDETREWMRQMASRAGLIAAMPAHLGMGEHPGVEGSHPHGPIDADMD